MAEGKKRSEQHLIDSDGANLLRSVLPRHWVLREYRPDYGLDFTVEVFRPPPDETAQPSTYETLGEHLFIQLKSVTVAKPARLKLYQRQNVEKGPESLAKGSPAEALDTIRFSMETSELVTIERMGVGVPVLLVIADISVGKCFFVCLNDYIDKILIPRHANYGAKASRTIHVPTLNEIGRPFGQVALRWYAKRPKLYAAFQRFIFQEAELRYVCEDPDAVEMAQYFASRIARYDFWDDTEMWAILDVYGSAIKRFLDTGTPGLLRSDPNATLKADDKADSVGELNSILRAADIHALWSGLSVLPRNYEDVCREWFIPSALGYAASYRGA